MTPRKVRMHTPSHTVHTVGKRLRRCAQPLFPGGAHGAHAHREMRTLSAHPPARPQHHDPTTQPARTTTNPTPCPDAGSAWSICGNPTRSDVYRVRVGSPSHTIGAEYMAPCSPGGLAEPMASGLANYREGGGCRCRKDPVRVPRLPQGHPPPLSNLSRLDLVLVARHRPHLLPAPMRAQVDRQTGQRSGRPRPPRGGTGDGQPCAYLCTCGEVLPTARERHSRAGGAGHRPGLQLLEGRR